MDEKLLMNYESPDMEIINLITEDPILAASGGPEVMDFNYENGIN